MSSRSALDGFDLGGQTSGPAVVEVWAPWCSSCRAAAPDFHAVAEEFRDEVDWVRVNAAEDAALTNALEVRGTPTLIGLNAGTEVFRITGRRSRSELRELVASLASGRRIDAGAGTHDIVLRTASGVALAAGGLAGFLPPAIAVAGGALALWGVVPWIQRRWGGHR